MTARDLLRLVFHRWYVMSLGAALTIGVLYGAAHQPGVYFTQYSVVVLPPRSDLRPNNIEDPRYGLTPIAGVLVSDYNGGKRDLLLASPDTTIYGEGLRAGSRVRLPNNGSQWQPIYSSPNIDVQIVGSTPEEVRSEATRIGLRLSELLQQRQDALRIQPSVRTTTLVSPQDSVITYVGSSRTRMALAIGVAGATMTTIAMVQFERWRVRRRSGRLPTGAPPRASSKSTAP